MSTAIGKIVESRTATYAAELGKLPFTKKTRGDLVAGFQDGMGNALATLRAVVRLPEYIAAHGEGDAAALETILERVSQSKEA